MTLSTFLIRLVAIYVITLSSCAIACTDFRITAKDGTVLIARSMEFAANLNSNVRSQPRGKTFTTVTPNGKPGMSWTSQYGYLYFDGMDVDAVIDGMNEKGLSIEALYLPGETQYQTVPTGKDKQAIPYLLLGNWILGTFSTVEDVRKGIENAYVFAQKMPTLGDMIFPLHYVVYDKQGQSIVLEFVNGKMHIYTNDVGILTNSPTYDWHVTNLQNYVNFSPYAPRPIVAGGMTFSGTGQGAGSVGLPGDVSPPSRFVKVAFLKKNAYTVDDARGALNLAEHIINTVDIPMGTVRVKRQNASEQGDYTQWVILKDLTHNVLYYRSYHHLNLRRISMDKVDFSVGAAQLKMPVESKPDVLDVTEAFIRKPFFVLTR